VNPAELPALIAERRRGLREPSDERADLIVGTQSYAVTIVDFSQVGLYLTFRGKAPESARLRSLVGLSACVDLVASPDQAALDPLEVRIVHALDDGLGVHVNELPEAWVKRLQLNAPLPIFDDYKATAHTPSVLIDTTLSAAPAPSVPSEAQRSKIDRCVKAYSGFAKTFMNESIARAIEELGSLEGAEPFQPIRSQYEDARITLTEQHSSLVGLYAADATRRAIAGPMTDSGFEVSAAVGSLRLMDTEELDSYLSLTSVIKALNDQLAKQHAYFLARYQRLVGDVNAKTNPFGIERTLRSMTESLSTVKLSATASRVLYGAVAQTAATRVPALFTELNQALAGVAPVDRPIIESVSRSRERAKEIFEQAGMVADQDALRVIDALRQARWSGGRGIPQRALAVIEAMTQGRTVSVDGQHFAQEPGDADGLLTNSGPQANVSDVLQAIDSLPTLDGQAFAPATVKRIADRVRAVTADGTATKSLGGEHNRMLETTAKLFQRANQDIAPNGDVQRLLKRLESTLLKLSLRDGDFPSLATHPARKVVNLIDQYALGADDAGRFEDDKLRRSLDSLVARICDLADTDPNVFAAVHENLEQDVERVRRERSDRVERVCEALESRDRIRAARLCVDRHLRERLSGRKLPKILIGLIDEFWRQHLVMLYVRFGDQDEGFRQALDVLERAFAVCADGQVDAATNTLSSELYVELAETVSVYCIDPALTGRLSADLQSLLMNRDESAINDSVQSPIFSSKDRQLRSEHQTTPTSNLPNHDDTAAPDFASCELGQWWNIDVAGRTTPVQTIWKSALTEHIGLANRSATQKIELTAEQFEKQIASGALRPRENLDVLLLDRAEAALLDGAYAESTRAAAQSPTRGLLTRKAFQARLNSLVERIEGGRQHVVGVFEFDQYRTISAAYGSDAIELLTAALTAKLQSKLPADAVLAALRDDSLAVLLPDCVTAAGEKTLQTALNSLADFHFQHQQHSYSIGVNVGVATLGIRHSGAADVLRHADAACLASKAFERNRLQRYESDSEATRSEEALMNWSGRADALLSGNDLYMRAQMVTPIGEDIAALPYYELLLGIEPLEGTPTSTFDFIVAMERLGRSHEIDLWVLRKCFAWVSENSTLA
jgi:GGDEF domain-containing protein